MERYVIGKMALLVIDQASTGLAEFSYMYH